jgi:hypothetical protein
MAAGDQRACNGSDKLENRLMRDANGIRGDALAKHVCCNALFFGKRGS